MAQLYYPLDPALVSEWPGDRGGWYHYGTDFAVPVGTPLAASFDGQVVFAGGDGASGQINGVWANGEGLTVDIRRADGLIARYGHLSRIDVRQGQWLNAGQIIGLSGNTGYTTGPHCHWELRWDRAWTGGAWADPRNLGTTALPKHAAPAAPKAWEDEMYPFSGHSARNTLQKIASGAAATVTYRDKHSPDASDRTICRGPGDMVGLVVQIRLKGKPGARVEMRLVRETGNNQNRVTLSEERRTFDSLGLATATLALSTPLKSGEMVRALVHGQKGTGDITVERFVWSGYARSH